MIYLLLYFLLSWLPPGAKEYPTTFAVIIGVSDYKYLNSKTGDLRYARPDAQRFARLLQAQSGPENQSGKLLLLLDSQATYTHIQQALQTLSQAKSSDRIIVYFSGHGQSDGLLPYDINPANPQQLITFAALKAALKKSKAHTKICIADACSAGGLRRPTGRHKQQPDKPRTPSAANVLLMLSSRTGQPSVESMRVNGGIFTHYLIEGLKGAADQNGNRIVTVKELYTYVALHVRESTPHQQIPQFYGRFPDDLSLAYL